MKLVIVEDQTFIRETLRLICTRDLGHEVVAEAETGAEGLERVLQGGADVLILDRGLPDLSGLTVAERVRAQRPGTRILMFSGYLDDVAVHHLERLGVEAFVDKNADTIAGLRAALAALEAGRTWYSPSYLTIRRALRTDALAFQKILSHTEQRILGSIGDGFTDREIAERFGLAATTVQTHRSHILRKLGIDGTPKLVAYAIRRGFTPAWARSREISPDGSRVATAVASARPLPAFQV